ncbi:MAG: acylglycerol kinase family protein [Clostridia bacterium]|nr:acylglycerol kinase family protein [Clostridia bacterium]
MRAAVIANPTAGRQTAQEQILLQLQRLWKDTELYGAAGFGGEFLPHTLPAPDGGSYLKRFFSAMDALTDREPDILVTVGGDGTAAYAAEYLLKRKLEIPIFGIGAGTANVGPIVSEHDAEHLPLPQELQTIRVGAIEALSSERKHIAYGFNDLVLGNTLLGSVNGQTVTLDAARMAAAGEKKVCSCMADIAGKDFSVSKNGRQLQSSFRTVGQVIASTVERDSYYGRAITGILCYTPDSPCQAAVCLTSVPIITCAENPEGFDDWLTCGQLLMQQGDLISFRGLAEGVCAVADGNPYLIPDCSVDLQYTPDLLKVLIRR